MRLLDFNKGITYLLTYFQSRDPGIGNFSIPDPGIEKTVPGLQTLCTSLWRRDRDAKGAGVEGRGIGRVSGGYFPPIADYDLVQGHFMYLTIKCNDGRAIA